MSGLFAQSEVGQKGIEELSYIFEMLQLTPLYNKVVLDLSLARGLDYYTGTIFEVKANDVEIGSITGGGRYDNLTGVFGLDGVSGVGISFGADRIFDVLNQLDLYPKEATSGTRLMFVNFGDQEVRYILPLLSLIRKEGIAVELYPEEAKLKKQMSYANALQIPYVAFVGEEEVQNKTITLKNMESGEQSALSLDALIAKVR